MTTDSLGCLHGVPWNKQCTTCGRHDLVPRDDESADHVHDYERGKHMAEAFGVDGRTFACAICGDPRP